MMVVLVGDWWALALRGLAAILFGVAAFTWPGLTLVALTLLFGVYALVDGVFTLVAAIRGRTGVLPWWALLFEGLIGIGAGMLTLAWPGLTVLA
ncbi:HdeD family acid-resistance protein [Singulisphaera rosea]